jgi:hypothetical protein
LFVSNNAAGDQFAPLCSLAVDVLGTIATGSATDNTPSEDSNGNGELDAGEDLNGNGILDRDTGIFFVSLLPGAANMTLNTDPFVPGDPMVAFTMTQTNPVFPAVATVEVEDGVGNSCQRTVQLGGFDPFGGISFTPTLNITLFLTRPTPNTDGVRCVETTDPDCTENPLDPEACTPDYGNIPFTPFPGDDPIELPFLLSEGPGTKIVCCQFIDDMGNISPPVCSTIVVGEDDVDPPSDDNVNGLLDLVNFTTQTDPTPCSAGSVGTFILDATFKNISAQASLENLISETAILSGGAVLCNADVAPSGVGSLLTIPEAGDYADGVLAPMETFDVRYEIGLASFGTLDFFVDILGDIVEVPAVETRLDFRNAGTRGSGQNQDLAEGSQPAGASAQSEIRGEGPAFSLTDGLTPERPNKADKKLSRARSRVGSRR